MSSFERISQALKYIDNHLAEHISIDRLADMFYLSPFYFHRTFSAIVGKAIAEYVRDRRLERACVLLSETDKPIIDVGLDCGYNSAQSFSRAFKNCFGIPPLDYRKLGFCPSVTTVDEMIIKFTNRLRGGVFVNPKIIKRDKLIIVGISGNGCKTGEVWEQFMELIKTAEIPNKLSDNGYEIRIYDNGECVVHVGYATSGTDIDKKLTAVVLPASHYAAFDVYPAKGYESENSAMDEWLLKNEKGYSQRLFDGKQYAVEFYDERFKGDNADSIVEIWVPVEKS
jgi:AraC-like DNA-binding protein/predicted transcriptional regulator YdeE